MTGRWPRDDLSELQVAEAEAKEAGRGLHGDPAAAVRLPETCNDDNVKRSEAHYNGECWSVIRTCCCYRNTQVVREVKHLEEDARAFVDKHKGKQLDGRLSGHAVPRHWFSPPS